MTNSSLPVRLSPRPVRTLTARIARSPFAREVASYGSFPFVCGLILIAAFLLGLCTSGSYVTWAGVYEIPAEMPSCGDYCGSDAGLITEPAR